MNWTLIAATNNEQILKSCLLGSGEASKAKEVLLQNGFSSAASAYNAALDQAQTDILVFAHQDVFLPPGWADQLQQAVEWFARNDPHWAVAGVWGVTESGARHGCVYCTGLQKKLGSEFTRPIQIRTLDELLLIVRKSSGLRFDEGLSGFHMYGTDICLAAQRQGMKCYAISAFCIHNTNGYGMLPWDFWKAFLVMRRKWNAVLPIITPCAEITRFGWPALSGNVRQAASLILKRYEVGKRLPDPARLYRELVATGKVRPVDVSSECRRERGG
jgi:hypothetical protein